MYSVFKDIPAVKFIKEGDIRKFVDEVENELKTGDLQEAIYDKRVSSFIEFHNWDNVAEKRCKNYKILTK